MEIRFLHTSDWHLGANLSELPSEKADYRRKSALEAISRMVSLSIDEKIDVVFISGDIFDNPRPSQKLKKSVKGIISPLVEAGKRIFVIPGNHDYYSKNSLWVENEFPEFHIFTSEGYSSIDIDELNLTVWGVPVFESNQDKNWMSVPPKVDGKRCNVLLFHGDYRAAGLEYESWHFPFELSDISNAPFAYIALGHHHRCNTIPIGDKIKAAYTGTPFGWTFRERERGHRYFILGKISDSDVELKIKQISVSEMQVAEVNMEYPSNVTRALDELSSFSKNDFVKLIIKGMDDPSDFMNKIHLFDQKFAYFKVEYDDLKALESESSENLHLMRVLKTIDEDLSSGKINAEFHSRLRSRAMRFFME